MPCDISKAERGYRLFDAGSFSLRLEQPRWQADTPVDQVIAELVGQLLGRVQRLAEQYRYARQWKLFRELTTAMAQLRACFGVFDLALPRSAASPFVAPLDALLAAFQPLVLAGWADDADGEAARREAEAVFDRQLEATAWGTLFVDLALWLLEQRWTQNRPPRGGKIAALPLERWLLAACGKEIQELRVPHNNDPEHAVSEWLDQLPRLGRLQLLLGHFRAFLQVPEPDRLFGELNKLQALLEQYPQVAEEQLPRQQLGRECDRRVIFAHACKDVFDVQFVFFLCFSHFPTPYPDRKSSFRPIARCNPQSARSVRNSVA